MNIILLSELVNKDGSRIKGDSKIDQDNSITTSKITTDDKVHMQRQGVSRYNNYGRVYVGEDNEEEVELPDEDKTPKKPKKTKKPKIKESSKTKMRSLIEDVFTKKDFDREFVKNGGNNMTTKEIGDLDSIRDTNPILIRKVGALKDIIEKNSASGEEKAIILNYLLSMDLTDISQNHKNELKKKLG